MSKLPYHSLRQARMDAAVEEAGRLRLTGMNYCQIAKQQKCTPQTAMHRVQRARALWLKSAADSYELWVARELAKLDLLWRETWEQWERSKRDKKQKSVRESAGPQETITTTQTHTGNPALIEKLIRIHERVCALKGLDAPRRKEILARADGPPISAEQFTDDELAAIVAGVDPASLGGGGYIDATSRPADDAGLHPIHVPEIWGQLSPPSSSGIP